MKCPRCREEIDCLRNRYEVVEYYDFDGESYEQVDTGATGGLDDYCCPHCMVTLASSEREAKAFLAGELDDEMAKRYAELVFEGDKQNG